MPDDDVPEYQNWPVSQEERKALACDVFGRGIVYNYDSWLNHANKMLFDGYQYGGPTAKQKEMLEWISRLSDEDKINAFTLVQEIASGVVFSMMNRFDGTSGHIVRGNNAKTGFEYCDYVDGMHIDLNIYQVTYEHGAEEKLVEAIPITESDEEATQDLHDLWLEWLEKYSHWK